MCLRLRLCICTLPMYASEHRCQLLVLHSQAQAVRACAGTDSLEELVHRLLLPQGAC